MKGIFRSRDSQLREQLALTWAYSDSLTWAYSDSLQLLFCVVCSTAAIAEIAWFADASSSKRRMWPKRRHIHHICAYLTAPTPFIQLHVGLSSVASESR